MKQCFQRTPCIQLNDRIQLTNIDVHRIGQEWDRVKTYTGGFQIMKEKNKITFHSQQKNQIKQLKIYSV